MALEIHVITQRLGIGLKVRKRDVWKLGRRARSGSRFATDCCRENLVRNHLRIDNLRCTTMERKEGDQKEDNAYHSNED